MHGGDDVALGRPNVRVTGADAKPLLGIRFVIPARKKAAGPPLQRQFETGNLLGTAREDGGGFRVRRDLFVEALRQRDKMWFDDRCNGVQTYRVISGEANVPFQFVDEGFWHRAAAKVTQIHCTGRAILQAKRTN